MPITVLVYRPGWIRGELVEIQDSLEDMRAIVGGHIEQVPLGLLLGKPLAHALVLICNEEGRLLGLRPNRCGIAGAFFIGRLDGPELVALTPVDVVAVRQLLDGGDAGVN